jgi:hypothetical protein
MIADPKIFPLNNVRNMLIITEENFNIRFNFIQGGHFFRQKLAIHGTRLTQTNFQVSIFKNLGV